MVNKKPYKLIIRMPNYLGDSIMAMFAIELLKKHYGSAHFTFVGQTFLQSLLIRQKINYKIVVSKNKLNFFLRTWHIITLMWKLKKEKFFLGVLFQNSFLNALIFKILNIKYLIGYNKEARKYLLDYYLAYDRESHYVNRYTHLVNSFLGNKYTSLPKINLYPQKVPEINFSNNHPIIGIYFGSDNKNNYPHIRVPSNKKAIEITHLIAQMGWNVVFFGDTEDKQIHQTCLKHFQEISTLGKDLTGKTTVRELIDSIFSVDVLITIDSAMMHIAAYVNVPIVVVLGRSSSPLELVKPKTEKAIYLKNENNMIDESKYIENITSNHVIEAVKLLIKN